MLNPEKNTEIYGISVTVIGFLLCKKSYFGYCHNNAGQWDAHVTKYGDDFGEGISVLYERGKGVVETTKLKAGGGAASAATQCAANEDRC